MDYNEAWKLLVSVRLAAQCTDERVNVIVQDLFARYPGVEALAAAEPDEEPDVPPHAARLSIMAAAKPRLNSFFILFLLL